VNSWSCPSIACGGPGGLSAGGSTPDPGAPASGSIVSASGWNGGNTSGPVRVNCGIMQMARYAPSSTTVIDPSAVSPGRAASAATSVTSASASSSGSASSSCHVCVTPSLRRARRISWASSPSLTSPKVVPAGTLVGKPSNR
jgi:hypothetical protein